MICHQNGAGHFLSAILIWCLTANIRCHFESLIGHYTTTTTSIYILTYVKCSYISNTNRNLVEWFITLEPNEAIL